MGAMLLPSHQFLRVENELGEIDIRTIPFVLFFTVILTSFFLIANLTLANNLDGQTQKEQVGKPSGYISKSEVGITAEVPFVLGSRKISENSREKAYLIFGNNNKGFSVYDCLLFNSFYNQTGMPGEGVIVKVPKSVQNTCIMPYY